MKVYPVGLVGEKNYQDQIGSCHAGEAVAICFERDNPYDDMALRVENDAGRVIGYIPKSSWLREAVHEEGRGVAATIKSIAAAEHGILGVVIDVTLTDDALPERAYGLEEGRRFWGLFSQRGKA